MLHASSRRELLLASGVLFAWAHLPKLARAWLEGVTAVQKDPEGWLRIANLGALPISMQQAAFARATGAPVTAPGAPAPAAPGVALRDTVASATPDLPF